MKGKCANRRSFLNILLSTIDVNDHKGFASVLNDLSLAEAIFDSQDSASVKFHSTFSMRWVSILTPLLP